MRSAESAFTLIELLVVVTIIVVLLALLTPALDKAIYSAELAMCAANQHGVAAGAMVYASDFRRRYPYRPGAEGNDKGAMNIRGGADRWDDRPITNPYFAPAIMGDPLSPKVDLGNKQSAYIWSAMARWYGFRYSSGNHKGMYRVGDRWTWTAQTPTGRREYALDILVSDLDLIQTADANIETAGLSGVVNGKLAHVAHPDDAGRLHAVKGENADGTASWWDSFGAPARGRCDFNAARSDGSVNRYEGVRPDEWEKSDRTIIVPEYPASAAGYPTRFIQVPVR